MDAPKKRRGVSSSECTASMMVADVADIPIVAGVKAGAGAEETVCVRDAADRDLSRNSMTDFESRDMCQESIR